MASLPGHTRHEGAEAVRYLVRFAAWLAPLLVALSVPGWHSLLQSSAAERLAHAAGGLLRTAGGGVITLGPWLVDPATRSYVLVDANCTGLLLCGCVAALLLAAPGSARRRLRATVAAVATLQVLNVVRIAHLSVVAQGAPGLFEPVHLWFWQPLMLLVAATLVWKLAAGPPKPVRPPPRRRRRRALLLAGTLLGLPFAAAALGGPPAGGGGGGGAAPFSLADPLAVALLLAAAVAVQHRR